MKLSWKRVGESKVHVYYHRPGYVKLAYIFQIKPGMASAAITAEIQVRDPVTGVRLVGR